MSPMMAAELAHYAVGQSIEAGRRDGLTREGLDRAFLIGRNDYRPVGREAVLDAIRALGPASEIATPYNDTEFWGRLDGYAWRVVVVRPFPGDETIKPSGTL